MNRIFSLTAQNYPVCWVAPTRHLSTYRPFWERESGCNGAVRKANGILTGRIKGRDRRPSGAEGNGDGLLQVVGNLGEMLRAAGGRNGPAAVAYVGCGGSQPTLSAALATCGVTSEG